MSEAEIARSIISYIVSQGGYAWKVHGSGVQSKGQPDIDGYIPTSVGILHLKIEVKTPTGRPSALQNYMINLYQKAGYVAGIVTSVDELKELIRVASQTR